MAIDSLKTVASPSAAPSLSPSVSPVSTEGNTRALRTPRNRVGEEFDFFLMTESAFRQQKEASRQNVDTMSKQSASVSVADATPVSPVSPDLTSAFVSDPAAEPAPVSTAVSAAIATARSSPVSPNPLVEENLLILNVSGENLGLESSLLGYGTENANFLPLGKIAKELAFNLDVDPQNGKAEGWFIEEGRKFQLDTRTQTLHVDGKSYPWQEGNIYLGDDDIYIDSVLLGKIFPVNFNLSTAAMELTVDPREKLPIQLAYEREQLRQGLQDKEELTLNYPLRKSHYDFFTFPRIDVATGVDFSNGDDGSSLPVSYSLQMGGDLLWMNSMMFLSGNSEDGIEALRGTFSRYDINGEMLGVMKATQFSFGDISPVSLSGFSSAPMGRGIMVSNRELDRSSSFDSIRFEGSLPSGWDVELYNGSSLIGSQRVGKDSLYSFKDISLHYGKNRFRLVAYGPQGQKRVLEEKIYDVGGNMIPPGKFEYSLSASDASRNLFPVGNSDEDESDIIPHATAVFSYGLSKNLSLNGGVSTMEKNGSRHNYVQAGFGGTLASIYGEGDVLADSNGGMGLSTRAFTSIGGLNFKLRHDWFDGEFAGRNSLTRRTSGEVRGTTPELDWLPPISCSLGLEGLHDAAGESRTIKNRISTYFSPFHITNSLKRDLSKDDAPIKGDARVSFSSDFGYFHAGMNYETGEEENIDHYSLGGSWQLGDGLSLGADFSHYPGKDYHNSIAVNLDWEADSFILSPNLSYNSFGDFTAGASLSFSLGRDPQTGDFSVSADGQATAGGVSAFVYNDANNNGIYDRGDSPVEGAEIASVQNNAVEKTGEEGVALFPTLPAHHPTDITIDTATLSDPAWQASEKGIALVPRPGHIDTVDIPVVATGEIDGSVYVINSSGRPVELSGLALELVDDKGKVQQTTVSEYDGFYLFDKIFPGEYILRIKEDGKEAAPHYEKRVTVGNNGDIISGNDIVLFNGRAYTPAPDLLEKGLVPPANPETSRFIAKLNAALPEKEKAVKEENSLSAPLRKKSANQLLEEALRRAPYPRIQPGSRRSIIMEQTVPQSTVNPPVQQQEKPQPIESLQQVEEELAIVAMSDPQLQPQADKQQRYSRARQAALNSLGISPSAIISSDRFSGSSIGPVGRPIKGFIPIAAPVQPFAPVTGAASSSRVVAVSHAAKTYAAFQTG